MKNYLDRIIEFSDQLGLEILQKDEAEALLIVHAENRGIYNLILDVEDPILVMEQLIYPVSNPSIEHYQGLLQINRQLVHGAFVLDEDGKNVLFRDTLQIENLDFNEFEGSINALSMGLAEFSGELLQLNQGS